ncbi:hypothetical protein PORY_002032 [Pneumocystis oryctolagi]|uniref:Uncharacterized protein n=1 Tax=Pneumocystis oryctolagi TaxID=42067 RepID=A0ACB7CHE2_9ASCO|nr:hypothetical protein PORY_002032 [Pneumocystis oryctolagi]
MKVEACFESIEQSIDSIVSLEFNYPKHFTNSLLKLKDISTLIRDAEPYENMLFTVEKGQKEPQKSNQLFLYDKLYGFMSDFCRQCAGVSVPLRNEELQPPETLLTMARKLLDVCHFPEMEEQIELLHEKNNKHLETIENLQVKINSQRAQLDTFLTNNYFDFEDKNEFVTEEMIQYEKDEIKRLEHEFSLRSKQLDAI